MAGWLAGWYLGAVPQTFSLGGLSLDCDTTGMASSLCSAAAAAAFGNAVPSRLPGYIAAKFMAAMPLESRGGWVVGRPRVVSLPTRLHLHFILSLSVGSLHLQRRAHVRVIV